MDILRRGEVSCLEKIVGVKIRSWHVPGTFQPSKIGMQEQERPWDQYSLHFAFLYFFSSASFSTLLLCYFHVGTGALEVGSTPERC
jgi:hypothetical protein